MMLNPKNYYGESPLTLLIYSEIKLDEKMKINDAFHLLNGLLYTYQNENDFKEFNKLRDCLEVIRDVLNDRNSQGQRLINEALFSVTR